MTHPLLTQLAADPRFAWQDIESAPKDGTYLLLSNGTTKKRGFYLTEKQIKDDCIESSFNAELLEPGWYEIEYHHPEFDEYYTAVTPTLWRVYPDPTQPNPLLEVVRVLVEGLEFYESLSNYARPVVDTYCNGERVYGLSEVEKYKGAKVAESLSQATKIIGGEE